MYCVCDDSDVVFAIINYCVLLFFFPPRFNPKGERGAVGQVLTERVSRCGV